MNSEEIRIRDEAAEPIKTPPLDRKLPKGKAPYGMEEKWLYMSRDERRKFKREFPELFQ